MSDRAAICIGVNRVKDMAALEAGANDARRFAKWAESQGCDCKVLVDDPPARVTVAEIHDAVTNIVDKETYRQLIVYFSGHGILTAPGAEYWLLSGAPLNRNRSDELAASACSGDSPSFQGISKGYASGSARLRDTRPAQQWIDDRLYL